MLTHHDPTERLLAVKSAKITPKELGIAILDHDPHVFLFAFQHPQAAHALEILATHYLDSQGESLEPRHSLLLADKRCTRPLAKMLSDLYLHDPTIPLLVSARMLKELPEHACLKKHSSHQNIFQNSVLDTVPPVNHELEVSAHSPHLSDAVADYHHHILTRNFPPAMDGKNKAVYRTDQNQFLVQPYFPAKNPLAGWAAMTASLLAPFYAQSFVAPHGTDGQEAIALVTPLKTFAGLENTPLTDLIQQNPAILNQAAYAVLLDYLTGIKRDSSNVLLDQNQLHLSDNSQAFEYSPGEINDHLEVYPYQVLGVKDLAPGYQEWSKNKDSIVSTVGSRLGMVTDSVKSQNILAEFSKRVDILNQGVKCG